MKKTKRPPIESMACVNEDCQMYAQRGQGNLLLRKTYGKDKIRYLRCQVCQEEFSERKGTALWNTKIPEDKAMKVAEQLSEGTSYKATARLVRVSEQTVSRLAKRLGKHGQAFHDEKAVNLPSTAIQADERWGFAGTKGQQLWEAEVIDPATRLVIERSQGKRDESLLEAILTGAHKRLKYPQGIVLFSDGEHGYSKLFKRIFGKAYRPPRKGTRGPYPQPHYRIGRRKYEKRSPAMAAGLTEFIWSVRDILHHQPFPSRGWDNLT